MKNLFKLIGIIALAAVIGFSMTACPEDDGGGNGDDGNKWWTWVSTQGEGGYDSTASVSMTPTSDKTGCDVSVTGTANASNYNWAAQVGYYYTATAGKTYRVSWKWRAEGTSFENVTIRWGAEQNYVNEGQYTFGTNAARLTIPTTEETKTYVINITSAVYHKAFTFFVGADTGSFTIRDFKVEEQTPGPDGTFTLTGIPSQYNGKYAVFYSVYYGSPDDEYEEYNDPQVIGCQSFNLSTYTITASLISDGSVSLPMWTYTNSGTNVTRYSGNDTFDAEVIITTPQTFNMENIFSEGVGVALVAYESVTFSNGSAARTWSQGEVSIAP